MSEEEETEEIKKFIAGLEPGNIPKIISIFTDKHLPSGGRVYPSKRLKQYCTKYKFLSNRLVIAYPIQDSQLWRLFQQSLSMRKRSRGVEFYEIDEEDVEIFRADEERFKTKRSVNKHV